MPEWIQPACELILALAVFCLSLCWWRKPPRLTAYKVVEHHHYHREPERDVLPFVVADRDEDEEGA